MLISFCAAPHVNVLMSGIQKFAKVRRRLVGNVSVNCFVNFKFRINGLCTFVISGHVGVYYRVS